MRNLKREEKKTKNEATIINPHWNLFYLDWLTPSFSDVRLSKAFHVFGRKPCSRGTSYNIVEYESVLREKLVLFYFHCVETNEVNTENVDRKLNC